MNTNLCAIISHPVRRGLEFHEGIYRRTIVAQAHNEDDRTGHGRAGEIMAPHSGVGGCAPNPRNPSPAAVRIMPAIYRVMRAMTDDMQSGAT